MDFFQGGTCGFIMDINHVSFYFKPSLNGENSLVYLQAESYETLFLKKWYII